MNDVFVVADAHGRLDLIEGLLALAGAERGRDRTVVQLGDLVNCVASSIGDDLATLAAAPELFDVLLCGNHEHPYFGGPTFSGFCHDPLVDGAIHRLEWWAAFAAGEFLVTHAGLGTSWGVPPAAVEGAAWLLNDAWKSDPGRHPFFASIGRSRGGLDEHGGILWADWQEPKATAGFSQIVGHTPGPIRVQGQPARVKDMKVLGRNADAARFVDGRPEGFEPDEPFALGIDLGASKGGKDYADPASKKIWPRVDALAGCWIRDGAVEVVVYNQNTDE